MTTAKLSMTLDTALVRQIRTRAGERGLSAFVNRAVAERLQRLRILDLLEDIEREHGVPSARSRAKARSALAHIFDET
jgi:hypothetical protein